MKNSHYYFLHRRYISLLTLVCGLIAHPLANADEYFDKYDLSPNTTHINIAVQPMAYPLAFISSTMQRDRLLRGELKKLGFTLHAFNFRKGNDIVKLVGDDKLAMALLGDMPTVNTLIRTPIYIVGLGKRNFSSIVSRDYARIEELTGKRVAYSAGSSSHLVLLRGLKTAKMRESDVTLVPMEPSQMPDALEAGTVDAYSAWEPTPSISLERNPKNRAIYRGMSTDWIIVSREFSDKQPQAALHIAASMARAINWMRAASLNAERAGHWVMADGEIFTGKKPDLSLTKAIDIARKDLLDVPGAPSIPTKVDGLPPLTREFEFLQQQGRVPSNVSVNKIAEAFSYTGLRQVQANPKKYRLYSYDYDQ